MIYSLLYHPKIEDDIKKIDNKIKEIIKRAIEQRLIIDPVKYGSPLRRGLKGYRKMRVGDYRVIYCIIDDEIRIVVIGHRRDVYLKANKRK